MQLDVGHFILRCVIDCGQELINFTLVSFNCKTFFNFKPSLTLLINSLRRHIPVTANQLSSSFGLPATANLILRISTTAFAEGREDPENQAEQLLVPL